MNNPSFGASVVNRDAWFGEFRGSSVAKAANSGDEAAAGQEDISMQQLFSGGQNAAGTDEATENSTGEQGGPSKSAAAPPDDLDIALSALKDCDNDYSKFVQESEGDEKK